MQNFLRVVMTFKKNVHLVVIPKKKKMKAFIPTKVKRKESNMINSMQDLVPIR